MARPGVRQTLSSVSNNAHKRASILRFYRSALSIFDNATNRCLNVCDTIGLCAPAVSPFALHFIWLHKLHRLIIVSPPNTTFVIIPVHSYGKPVTYPVSQFRFNLNFPSEWLRTLKGCMTDLTTLPSVGKVASVGKKMKLEIEFSSERKCERKRGGGYKSQFNWCNGRAIASFCVGAILVGTWFGRNYARAARNASRRLRTCN